MQNTAKSSIYFNKENLEVNNSFDFNGNNNFYINKKLVIYSGIL